MIVRPFPQSDPDRFGNPQRHTASIILKTFCGEIPRISAPPSALIEKNEIIELVDIAICGDGVMAIDHCTDGGRRQSGGRAAILGISLCNR
jgi:hypothetical protein